MVIKFTVLSVLCITAVIHWGHGYTSFNTLCVISLFCIATPRFLIPESRVNIESTSVIQEIEAP